MGPRHPGVWKVCLGLQLGSKVVTWYSHHIYCGQLCSKGSGSSCNKWQGIAPDSLQHRWQVISKTSSVLNSLIALFCLFSLFFSLFSRLCLEISKVKMNKMRNLWKKTEKNNFKLFQDQFQDWWCFSDEEWERCAECIYWHKSFQSHFSWLKWVVPGWFTYSSKIGGRLQTCDCHQHESTEVWILKGSQSEQWHEMMADIRFLLIYFQLSNKQGRLFYLQRIG